MEYIIVAIISGLVSLVIAFGVAWLNRKAAVSAQQIAVDAEVYKKAEAHYNNIIHQQDVKLVAQDVLIRHQDAKIDQLEQDRDSLKIALFDVQMVNKRLEIEIDDLKKKVTGQF